MNLIVDVGNSLVKLAVFQGESLLLKESITHNNVIDKVKFLENQYTRFQNVIIASVGKLKQDQFDFFQKSYNVLLLDHRTMLPFQNHYETPQTLGVDRIALVAAAVWRYPHTDCLIIDTGTCITYDFINNDKIYLGGAISPGIHMRYQALNHFTANLPLLERDSPNGFIGRSTNASIHSGVINGVVRELEGIIAEYESKYSDLTVILTGGDSKFLSKQLKSSIFANSNFLLEGLNYILQFNSN